MDNKTGLRELSLLFVVSAAFVCSSGCRKAKPVAPVPGPTQVSNEEVLDKWGALYGIYLHQDTDHARKSQQESAELIQASDLPPSAKAHALYFTYSRLYLLECKAGDRPAAKVDFIKAKYWFLRECELEGDSVAETASNADSFTPEKCTRIVLAFAKRINHGKEPDFVVHHVTTTRSNDD